MSVVVMIVLMLVVMSARAGLAMLMMMQLVRIMLMMLPTSTCTPFILMEKRFQFILYYIMHNSFSFDSRINHMII